MKIANLSKTLELSVFLLKPEATENMVKEACKKAVRLGLYGVNVNLNYLETCLKILKNSDTKVIAAVGYPLGANGTEAKIFEAKQAVKLGADEIEVVMDIGAFKSDKYNFVKKELKDVVQTAKKPVSVIIEVPLLTDKEIKKSCELVLKSGADFVKSSAGTNRQVAAGDIQKIRNAVGKRCRIKGAGKIQNLAKHLEILKAGADRNVTSYAIEIMEEAFKRKFQ